MNALRFDRESPANSLYTKRAAARPTNGNAVINPFRLHPRIKNTIGFPKVPNGASEIKPLLIALCVAAIGISASCAEPQSNEASSGQTPTGVADVIDGDGLKVAGVAIRLFGIDAVEGDQTCNRNGEVWSCGVASKAALRGAVEGKIVRCEGTEYDQYERLLGVCFLPDGTDINRNQVELGWAVAYTRFSNAYEVAEAVARSQRLGIWESEFERPEEFRRRQREEREAAREPSIAPNEDCVIKGNISRNSGNKIFHVPGQADYEATHIDEVKGERWFCSEAEAIAAGWRKARR